VHGGADADPATKLGIIPSGPLPRWGWETDGFAIACRAEVFAKRGLSGLARNFGDVFELWSGGQCGVGVVVSGDALE